MESTKNKLLSFSENHPHIMLFTVVALVIIIVLLWLRSKGILFGETIVKKEKLKNKKKKKDLEDDLDELIDSIKEKQS